MKLKIIYGKETKDKIRFKLSISENNVMSAIKYEDLQWIKNTLITN